MSGTPVGINPNYNDEDADLFLVSGDGQRFRVHSNIMIRASGIFKTMINIGPEGTSRSCSEQIHIPESQEILRDLLDAIYPEKAFFASNENPDLAHFRDLCYAAEKYEMTGVLSSFRILLQSVGKNYPILPAYALASRYEWRDELQWLSTRSLSINLFSPERTDDLRNIPSDKLVQLINLHRKRRDLMIASLKLEGPSAANKNLYIRWEEVKLACLVVNPSFHLKTHEQKLAVLEYRISAEMERHPDGSSIRELTFWDRSEFNSIWFAECQHCVNARGPMISKYKFRTEVQ